MGIWLQFGARSVPHFDFGRVRKPHEISYLPKELLYRWTTNALQIGLCCGVRRMRITS